VYFVYLGRRIPEYGLHSLRLADQWSGLPIHLIASEPARKTAHAAGVDFTCIEDFYDQTDFTDAAPRLTATHTFRGGLWLKSLERLFVLQQFARLSSLKTFIHAELDQLLFRVDLMQQHIADSSMSGVFFPLQDTHEGLASLLFCNDLGAFETILSLARNGAVFPNEMRLLGTWANLNRGSFIELPTIPFYRPFAEDRFPSDFNHISTEMLGGIVDAAQLGQWLAGEDPRNVPIKRSPKTRFCASSADRRLALDDLERVRFRFDSSSTHLTCDVHGFQPINIYNLHLHSKVHKWVNRRDGLQQLLRASDRHISLTVPGTRRTQVVDRVAYVAREVVKNPEILGRRAMRGVAHMLSLRPSSYPYISGDTFRSACHFSFDGADPSLRVSAVRPRNAVFCESHLLERFLAEVVPQICDPITLVLGNSDFDPSPQLARLLPSPQITNVFAQNLSIPIEGVNSLPIGLENAWRHQHGVVSLFNTARQLRVQKLPRIMCAFSIHTNPGVRVAAANALLNNHLASQYQALQPRDYVSTVRLHQFIACPPGNGLDTHRVWESLYLGTIPIVYQSQAMRDFQELGLPIWIVANYSDLADLTERDLVSIYNDLAPRFDSKWLWADPWIEAFGGPLS